MARVIFPSLDADAPRLTEALGLAFDDYPNTPSLLLATGQAILK